MVNLVCAKLSPAAKNCATKSSIVNNGCVFIVLAFVAYYKQIILSQ
jgi:hypothetical protein